MSQHHRLTGTLLSVLLLLSDSNPIAADDPQRPQDAKQATTLEALVTEIEQALTAIPDPPQRLRTMSPLIHRLKAFTRAQRAPLVSLLENTLSEIDDPSLLSRYCESLTAWDPELSVQIAHRLDDERRDRYLSYMVAFVPTEDLAVAERIVKQVQAPENRERALYQLATRGSLAFDAMMTLLPEYIDLAKESGKGSYQRAYPVTRAFIPFARTHTKEIIAFVNSHLDADDAVGVLSGLAWDRLILRHDRETALLLYDEAVKIVPKTAKPHYTALRMLGGYGRARPKEALDLFDRVIVPGIGPASHFSALAELASFEIDAVLPRAQHFTAQGNQSADELAARALGSAASSYGPEKYIAWLEQAEPSAMRDRAVAQIASGLGAYYSNNSRSTYIRKFVNFDVQGWVTDLWSVGQQIAADELRFDACFQLVLLVRRANFKVPESLRQEFVRLIPETDPTLRAFINLLPVERQRRVIGRGYPGKEPEEALFRTAGLVRNTALPDAEKLRILRELYAKAAAMDEPYHRVRILAAAAICIGSVDFREAIERMKEVREIDLRETDVSLTDALGMPTGSPGAPGGIEEYVYLLVRLTREHRAANAVEALREYAERVPAADRDVVRVGLSRVLIQQQRLGEALEEARRITAPARRAETLAEVVEAMFPR